MANLSKGDVIFGETYRKINELITKAFNTSTLRRGITTSTQKARIQSLERKIRALIGSKKVFNAISKAQYYELENLATERIANYKNDRITKSKKKEGLKTKPKIIKTNVPVISEVAKKRINVKPQSTVTTLIDSLGGFTQKKSTSTAVAPYDAIKAQSNKVNFNLRGYSLFENVAYNAKIHGVSNTIQELDLAVKEGKIDASEAENIKKTITKTNIKSKLNQLGTNDQVRQFNKPAYQKAFKTFLNSSYNTLTKMGKVVNKVAPKVFAPIAIFDMKKQYDEIMEQSKKPIEPLTYKSGGKVKRKPYAMGGKVYGNSVRKPKFK
jgi:hypothetical protein